MRPHIWTWNQWVKCKRLTSYGSLMFMLAVKKFEKRGLRGKWRIRNVGEMQNALHQFWSKLQKWRLLTTLLSVTFCWRDQMMVRYGDLNCLNRHWNVENKRYDWILHKVKRRRRNGKESKSADEVETSDDGWVHFIFRQHGVLSVLTKVLRGRCKIKKKNKMKHVSVRAAPPPPPSKWTFFFFSWQKK